jgi:hypothetical protein
MLSFVVRLAPKMAPKDFLGYGQAGTVFGALRMAGLWTSQMLDRRGFLLGGVTLMASQGSSASPVAISLDPARWQIGPIIRGKSYSPGMPSQPTAAGSGWSFTFPALDGVHYVTTPLSGPLMGHGEVKVRFSIAGSGRLVPTQGEPPARMRLFLHRRGDDWSGVGAHEFYRWWSVSNVVMAAGKYELAAPLVPDHWFSVFGKRGDHPAAAGQFVAAVADLHAVGQTFGGMFAGHGVFAVDGPSRFTLESYEIA